MENNTRKAFYKVISLCLKTAIVAVTCGWIYKKVVHREDLSSWFGSREPWLTAPFIVSVLLMPLNWMLEAQKWKLLIAPLERTGFAAACKAVLSGLSVSIVTPNRAGEFAGRIFFLETANRVEAACLSLAGSACQLFITLLTGALSFLLLRSGLVDLGTGAPGVLQFVGLIALLSFLFFLLVMFLLPYLLSDTAKSGIKWIAAMDALNQLGFPLIFRITMLSFARYGVFFFQFYLLLSAFGAALPVGQALVLLPLTFFAISVIPTVAFTEVGVRGTAALLLIGPFTLHAAPVMSASFMLWVINIAVPALAGCFFVPGLHFFREKK